MFVVKALCLDWKEQMETYAAHLGQHQSEEMVILLCICSSVLLFIHAFQFITICLDKDYSIMVVIDPTKAGSIMWILTIDSNGPINKSIRICVSRSGGMYTDLNGFCDQ